MKSVSEHQPIINVIAYSIQNDPKGVKMILKRNGVDTSMIAGKKQLRKAFLNSLSKSKAVALDFNRYVKAKIAEAKFSSFSGRNVETVSSLEPEGLNLNNGLSFETTNIGNPSSESSVLPDSNKQSGGFFSGLNLKDLINTGVNILEIQRDMQVSKDTKDAVNNAVQVKQDEMSLQPNASSNNTGLFIALGVVGVAMIGTVIYFATKKK